MISNLPEGFPPADKPLLSLFHSEAEEAATDEFAAKGYYVTLFQAIFDAINHELTLMLSPATSASEDLESGVLRTSSSGCSKAEFAYRWYCRLNEISEDGETKVKTFRTILYENAKELFKRVSFQLENQVHTFTISYPNIERVRR